MRIMIAGAGIGGLTLALALHRRGLDVTVFEAVEQPKALGVGINLLPHAVKELTELGLQAQLAETGIETSSLHYFNKFGQGIWHEPRGREAGYPWPQFSIHRGELLMILLSAARRELGAERIITGRELIDVSRNDQPVEARFRCRAEGRVVTETADVLVGADGIHSALRRYLFPHEGMARFSGRMLWRAVTLAQPFLDGRTMFMAGHQDLKFVAYPISEPLRREGKSLINWIAESRVESGTPARNDWNRQVSADVFERAFADWRWDWIDIPAIIRGAQAVYEYPLVDRDPLPHWSVGRVTLLGDAAHPMYPIGSNGASQAILDARCLVDSLCEMPGDPQAALARYDAERRPKTAAVVLANRQNGPEQMMQLAEERAPDGFRSISDVISLEELTAIAARYKQLAGFDRTRLAAGS
ncbi:flavin-dependent oxidoreductase [Trinickia diaoshuihuensis]|uniref:flavin-dependent oxidoreductase n=1 Tax=Trinickia diaoshuihuensis TaxID=2292265 RepID=UPI000E28974B|nr:flavin-dependent oxidoreductase [Trinickia diaoshuihuensis]